MRRIFSSLTLLLLVVPAAVARAVPIGSCSDYGTASGSTNKAASGQARRAGS